MSVWMVTMNSITLTRAELARSATLSVLLAPLPLLSVPHVTLLETELLESTLLEGRLVFVLQDSTRTLTVHVLNLTVTLILSVLSASRVSSFV